MPETPLRLCIFGDSHYACLKIAEARGMVDVSEFDLEYWGHVGGRFRYLEFRDGAIRPTDEFTARRFAKFNAKGRLFLPASDFDFILVAGARVYLIHPFLTVLRARCHGPFLSEGLQRRILADRLRGQSGYRLAAALAAERGARIILAPVAFPTDGDGRRASLVSPEMAAAGSEDRAGIWSILGEIAAEDGIILLPQPDETVTGGVFTKTDYAVDNYAAKKDFEHRNAAYGALILSRAAEMIRRGL